MTPPASSSAATDRALAAELEPPRPRWKTLLRRTGKALAFLAFLVAVAAMLSSLTHLFAWPGGY